MIFGGILNRTYICYNYFPSSQHPTRTLIPTHVGCREKRKTLKPETFAVSCAYFLLPQSRNETQKIIYFLKRISAARGGE